MVIMIEHLCTEIRAFAAGTLIQGVIESQNVYMVFAVCDSISRMTFRVSSS